MPWIVSDPDHLGGKPRVRDTRIAVAALMCTGSFCSCRKKPRNPVDTFACIFSARRAGVGKESCSGLFCLCLVPPDPHNPTHPHLSNSFLRRELCSDGEGGCQLDGTSRSLPTISWNLKGDSSVPRISVPPVAPSN